MLDRRIVDRKELESLGVVHPHRQGAALEQQARALLAGPQGILGLFRFRHVVEVGDDPEHRRIGQEVRATDLEPPPRAILVLAPDEHFE
jgi:hypothetical protein